MCEQDADYNTESHITLYRFMLHPVNAGLSLSPSAVSRRAKVAATVASFFCVDESSIAYLGHSDGGAMAEGIPVYVSKSRRRAAQRRRERRGDDGARSCGDAMAVDPGRYERPQPQR